MALGGHLDSYVEDSEGEDSMALDPRPRVRNPAPGLPPPPPLPLPKRLENETGES